jgi:hypothetical protein
MLTGERQEPRGAELNNATPRIHSIRCVNVELTVYVLIRSLWDEKSLQAIIEVMRELT